MTREEAISKLETTPWRGRICDMVKSNSLDAEAVFTVRERGQKHWEYREWEAVLKELDNCRLRVDKWLELETLIL